ncbi:MAG: hypothetical protein A2355_12400 [Spirochaetes bacterium RIFOXYB1_FULL_32_8]|nr:MAG: hypothetical protein A2Y30_03255 [Spirochaetes bacterium GWE1_32_154]OHD48200.1 MAG: hypothetical protein A2Y29_07390 [Spirochaetes bacterium GWE2_31_10]OHD78763.1 MAG: hypothetical protein A2355_12400 [Spirochaetes bacterium RIFOXYB1_FULL_32_8]HBI36510.1 flagellar assembly protein FliH [Spirochaetia bacterium]
MSKNLFKYGEIQQNEDRYRINAPDFKHLIVEEILDEELEGKSLDDLRQERDAYEAELEEYKKEKALEAEAAAKEIIEKAKSEAFEILKKKNNEAQEIKQKAEDEAQEIVSNSKNQAKQIENDIADKEQKILTDARKRGYQDGWQDGIKKGEDEVKRLIERIHVVLDATIEKRNDVFVETEQQIIGLVLLIAKKVIKVISDNQKNVVINNVVQALRKLKSRGEVAIRVNLADLELTSQHKRDFIEMVEGVKSIKILEDSTVDRGGCIIETDFGSLDARISSQLHEIEERILELIPIQAKGKEQANPV